MSSTTSSMSEKESTDYFLPLVEDILDKLRQDPGSITTDDARRLSENAVVGDLRTARIVAAVKAFAAHNEGISEVDPRLGQAPDTSLLTVINDLSVAVEHNTEVLRAAQSVISKMQRAVGHSTPANPEVELQEEVAKIEPKVAEGTVTIEEEEANHLHKREDSQPVV